MGVVSSGVPKPIALKLAAAAGATVFVETGTYRGDTTRWAAQHFAHVYTIEKSELLFGQFSVELRHIPAVTPLLGDSRTVLPIVMEKLVGMPALIWLDGHWSGGETSGFQEECPILEELQCLASRRSDVILIDDARFFLCSPPRPHLPAQWPTIVEVLAALNTTGGSRLVQILDDVIFAVPKDSATSAILTAYSQQRAEDVRGREATEPVTRRLYRWLRRRLA